MTLVVFLLFTLSLVPAVQADEGVTIAVNTFVDDVLENGNCTLREAITAANTDLAVDACPPGSGADTILLPEGVYALQILSDSNELDSLRGDLDILTPMTVEGQGAGATIVGFGVDVPLAQRDHTLEVRTTGSVRLLRITIAGSASGKRGAGISNSADLTLEDSAVIDNHMDENGGFFGGGIYNFVSLHLVRSLVSGNSAPCGGGIYNEGQAWITESTFTENTAADNSLGGAIFSNGSLWIEDSEFTHNQAGGGGAIGNYGSLVMTNSQMHDNLALHVAGALETGRTARLENVSVQSNHSDGEVGAIRNSGTLEIYNSVIRGNSNGNGLGTVYQLEGSMTVEDTLIEDNFSARNGGALMAYHGDIVLRRVEMKGNRAYNGGAIYAGANLTLEDSVVSGNTAVQYGGGVGQFGGQFTIRRTLIENNTTGEKGGGVYQEGGALVIEASDITGNASEGWGGGTYIANQAEILTSRVTENTAEYGGGLYNRGEVRIQDSHLDSNSAQKDGGGVYNTAQLEVISSVVSGNHAYNTSGGAMGGGGIASTGSLEIDHSAVDENFATGRGGGISNAGDFDLNNSSLVENVSQDFGGGICSSGSLTAVNVTLSLNQGRFGGGMGLTGGTSLLLHVTIFDNSVVMEPGNASGGGGINLWGGELTIQNSVVAANRYTSGESGPFQDCISFPGYSVLHSSGNNLIGIAEGCEWAAAAGDQTGTLDQPLDPLLLPLQTAGITRYALPGADSPLIDTASMVGCPAADQRGVSRPQGPGCDIGAVEVEQPGLSIDIKPKSALNKIDPRSPGHVAVAVLSSPEFNAPLQINPQTLTFGRTGSEASLLQVGDKLLCSPADANADGLPDLICQFEISRSGLQCGDQGAFLMAGGPDLEYRVGWDKVLLSPCP